MLRRRNEALPGLICGIFIYGIVVELIGVWFVQDKVRFTSGLVIGILLASWMAYHMATVLMDALERGEGSEKMLALKSVIRYLVVVAVFFIMMKFNLGNLISAFIGVFGLKISAYLQPLAHKFILQFICKKRENKTE